MGGAKSKAKAGNGETTEKREERGMRLRSRMKELDLSPTQLALRTGLSRSQIYRLSKGQEPTPEQQGRLDTALRRRPPFIG